MKPAYPRRKRGRRGGLRGEKGVRNFSPKLSGAPDLLPLNQALKGPGVPLPVTTKLEPVRAGIRARFTTEAAELWTYSRGGHLPGSIKLIHILIWCEGVGCSPVP